MLIEVLGTVAFFVLWTAVVGTALWIRSDRVLPTEGPTWDACTWFLGSLTAVAVGIPMALLRHPTIPIVLAVVCAVSAYGHGLRLRAIPADDPTAEPLAHRSHWGWPWVHLCALDRECQHFGHDGPIRAFLAPPGPLPAQPRDRIYIHPLRVFLDFETAAAEPGRTYP